MGKTSIYNWTVDKNRVIVVLTEAVQITTNNKIGEQNGKNKNFKIGFRNCARR